MEILQGQGQAERQVVFSPAGVVELHVVVGLRCSELLQVAQAGLRWEWRDLNMKIYGDSGLLSVDLKYLKTKLVLKFSSLALYLLL